MAGKEMVSKETRTKIGSLLTELANEKGNLRLAMLAQPSTELPGRWSLVVSAPWMDSIGPRTVISDLTNRLLKRLAKKELGAIDRVSVLSTADPLVGRIIELLHDFLGVEVSETPGGFYISNSRLEDWDLPQAFVFIADPSVAFKPLRTSSSRRRASAR